MIDGGVDTTTTSSRCSKMTLKAAVQACWPNETPIDVVRLIQQGNIEILSTTTTTSTTNSSTSTDQMKKNDRDHPYRNDVAVTNTGSANWKIVRQHGKRIIYPNQYIRRRCHDDNDVNHNNNKSVNRTTTTTTTNNIDLIRYDVRMVPSYPIVIAMYKPPGYIVTTTTNVNKTTTNTRMVKTTDNTSNEKNGDDNSDDENNNSNDDDDDDGTDGVSSSSVYDLLRTSVLQQQQPQQFDTIATSTNNGSISIPTSSSIIHYVPQLRAVGRLDKNTEGLLLFTNQGRWNIALTNPSKVLSLSTHDSSSRNSNTNSNTTTATSMIWKRYRCYLQHPATEYDLQQWIQGGIPFRHQKSSSGMAYSLPARSATFVSSSYNTTTTTQRDRTKYRDGTVVDVTIGEGKYRQVRRCWESLSNNKVLHLQRLSFGPIELLLSPLPSDHTQQQQQQQQGICWQQQLLQPGQCRLLSINELQMLEHYVHAWYRNNPNYNGGTT